MYSVATENANSCVDWWCKFFTAQAAAGGVSLLLIVAGIFVLYNLKPDSPLNRYVLQILGLTFILPVVLLLGVTIQADPAAITGLLGTIVGYVFGTSQVLRQGNQDSATSNPDRSSSD